MIARTSKLKVPFDWIVITSLKWVLAFCLLCGILGNMWLKGSSGPLSWANMDVVTAVGTTNLYENRTVLPTFSPPLRYQHTPPASPLGPGQWSCIPSIMKPYKPVICCFTACFMKVSWQAAPRMVPVTLTDNITKRIETLGREDRAGWRMGQGLYVSPVSALMGRGLAAGYHRNILCLPPFVRGTLLTFDLCPYSHLLFSNQLPHRSINQTGW